jgi:putative tricarboxylic transport membrane protein
MARRPPHRLEQERRRVYRFIKSPKDFYCGLLLIAIAAIFAWGLGRLPIGTAFRMGPGYFPLVLTIFLAALGAAILINGLRAEGEPIGDVPWRGVAFTLLPIVFFGATLKGLGFVPSLAATVLASTFAGSRWDLRYAITIVIVLVLAAVAIFVFGLGLPLSLFGPWVGGY